MSWLKEEFARVDRSPKALRRFGFVAGAASILFGLVLLHRHRAALPSLGLGALLITAGCVAPRTLKYLHAAWVGLSLLLGWVMSRIIVTLVFFLVVTPIGLLQRLVSRSGVDLRFRTGASSYWLPRDKPFAPAEYRNQF
jgi:hypothetical protein